MDKKDQEQSAIFANKSPFSNQATDAAERAFSSSPSDRRLSSDEWDASKVPPSRFQKRKGSIYATPGSRDGHVDRNYAAGFHEMHNQKGYGKSPPTTNKG